MYDAVATGRRIRQTRRAKGLTQKKLGDRIGISDRHISSIENGRENPGFELLIRLCEALGVTPDYLLLGSMRDDACDGISERLRLCDPGQQRMVKMMIEVMLRSPVWPEEGAMQIETCTGWRRVNKKKIVYVEAAARRVYIHTTECSHETGRTMAYWEDVLDDPQFCRTHQSFIVNLTYVTGYDRRMITLHDGRKKAYMARSRYGDFCRRYAGWLENTEKKDPK